METHTWEYLGIFGVPEEYIFLKILKQSIPVKRLEVSCTYVPQ